MNDATIAEVSTADFVRVMVTNALGPMRVVEAFEDLVKRRGTIGVMSSGLGSISWSDGYLQVYSASKAALNMLMKGFAARHAARTTVIIAPGWVRTDLAAPTPRAKHSARRRCDHEPHRQAWPAFRQLSRRNSSLVSWYQCRCAARADTATFRNRADLPLPRFFRRDRRKAKLVRHAFPRERCASLPVYLYMIDMAGPAQKPTNNHHQKDATTPTPRIELMIAVGRLWSRQTANAPFWSAPTWSTEPAALA